jgi:4'-phosphopantetheinyl transferase
MRLLDPGELLAAQGGLQARPQAVRLWYFSLRGTAACTALAWASLSREERERADRLLFAQDRADFIVARGVLRSVLAGYRAVAPAALRIEAGPSGKPHLAGEAARSPPRLAFNLSHSHGRALLAVGTGGELGVDLERLRGPIDALAIAGNYFFGAERAAIEALEPARRPEAFFRYWVAKEAVLKAEGGGLGLGLDRFEIRFRPDGAHADVRAADPSPFTSAWNLRLLPVGEGWTGALATCMPEPVRIETGAAGG